MANHKVPSQAASGGDTFSDFLVGNQITDGSSQMTGTNFAIDKVIPEKDIKEFITQPFSDFITLDEIKEDNANDNYIVSATSQDIKFNNDKNNADRSLYGSLKQRLGVSVSNIITKYPAAIMADTTLPVGLNSLSAESVVYDPYLRTTEFKVQYSLLFNPLDIVLIEPKTNIPSTSDNIIRNFYSSYTKYVIDIDGSVFDIIEYIEPNSDNKITLKVDGNCFNNATGFTENYLIRPNDGILEKFYGDLDEIESVLLNRESNPKFNAGFNVPRETNGGYNTDTITVYINWPISRDGWNIQITGINYDYYINQLSSLGDEIDSYKSNLIIRFLTAQQLYEFDTEEKKIESIFQIYGQSFDQVKKFIDNIAYMRNISYNKVNNLPDILLKNLSETLGLSTVNLFDEKTLSEALYTRHNTQYDGISTGTNLIEAEYEFYRRILINLAHLYKSKGTRGAIEFFLKFIGAPEPIIKLDEYVYVVDSALPSKDIEADIWEAMQGIRVVNIASPLTGVTGSTMIVTGYTLSQLSGSTTLTRDEYPVDEMTGLPRKATSSDGSIFFEMGAGWYRKLLDHRSHDILDSSNSNLTSRVKTIKTISKPFTYGEDYFNIFRQLPGLDYGYGLSSKIDNKKIEIVTDENISKLTLNRKNINVFLSADRAIDYDVYRKSRDLSLTFGTLPPQTGVTFVEFLNIVLNNVVTNSHVIKYKNTYPDASGVYEAYLQSSGFTPYNYISVLDFINNIGPYWTNIIDQFIPATTLWLGGELIENGSFARSKYEHSQPCFPATYTQILYPDFENVIREDLETIIGGGSINGEDVSLDNFRGVQFFGGVGFSISLNIDGTIYSRITTNLKPFGPYTPSPNNCTILPPSSDSIPLLCGYDEVYNIWSLFNGGDSVDDMKVIWKETLDLLITDITGYTIVTEYFIDVDGIEKVRFTIQSNDYYSSTCNEFFDYYFEPFFNLTKQDCSLEVLVNALSPTYTGDTSCELISDIYFTISGAIGDEFGRGSVYVHQECDDDVNINPRIQQVGACEFIVTGFTECDLIHLIFTDAANCEQRIEVDGLQLVVVEISTGISGFTATPIVEYRPSFNYGIRKGTIIYKVIGTTPIPLTQLELDRAIFYGYISGVTIENVLIGDTLLSVEFKPFSGLTSQQFIDAEINGYQFAFNYDFIIVENIECFSSVKTNIINNQFEILPTSKVLVYTNMGLDLEETPHHFEYKYPEDIYVKVTGDTQNGDFLVNQYGFLIEVSDVYLDYCSDDNYKKIYYQLNCSGSSDNGNIILFNGDVSGHDKIMVRYAEEKFDTIDYRLNQYYTAYGQNELSPINQQFIRPCNVISGWTECIDVAVDVSPTPTPSITSTITPTPTVTPMPTRTSTITPTLTPTPTPTITRSPSVTIAPTSSLSPTPTISVSVTVTVTPSITFTPTPTPTLSLTPTATSAPVCNLEYEFIGVSRGIDVTPTPTPSITPIIPYSGCSTCHLQLSGATGGYFLSSNRLISSGSTCTVGDYVIEWRTNSVSGPIELITGIGSDPSIQQTHPFTNEIVTQGTYYPVIKYVDLNGIRHTPYLSELTGSTLYSPDLLTCINASPIIINPITCGSTYNNDGVYPFVLTYRNAVNVSEDKSRTLSFQILSTSKYFAWEFAGYEVADQFKVSYCTTGGTETLVDNFIIGTRGVGGSTLVTNIYPANYPTDPKIYYYYGYQHGSYGVKYISDLSGFVYSSGDYLRLDVIGAVYEPANNDTNWDMKLKCFTDDEISSWTFMNSDVYKMIPIGTSVPIMTHADDPNCYYNVTYSGLTGYSATALNYKPTSDYMLLKYTDMWKYVSGNIPSNNNMTNPANVAITWKISALETYAWAGSLFVCADLALPTDTMTITPDATTGATISFTNIVDYNKFVSNISSIQSSAKYVAWSTANPTSLDYYSYYFINWIYAPNNCGDSKISQYIYIHFGSTIEYNVGDKTIKFIYNIPTNGMTNGITCNDSYITVQSDINSMINTSNNPIIASHRTTHVRASDPVSGRYIYNTVTTGSTQTTYAYVYIDEGMINGIFDPSAFGFMYHAINPVSGVVKQWVLWRSWDRLTLTDTSTDATRLDNWKLERKIGLRTSDPTKFGLSDWETVYQIP